MVVLMTTFDAGEPLLAGEPVAIGPDGKLVLANRPRTIIEAYFRQNRLVEEFGYEEAAKAPEAYLFTPEFIEARTTEARARVDAASEAREGGGIDGN